MNDTPAKVRLESSMKPHSEIDRRGSHLGDFLPPDQLQTFLAKARGEAVTDANQKIDASNKGHAMLQKMGWSEGACLSCAHCMPVGAQARAWVVVARDAQTSSSPNRERHSWALARTRTRSRPTLHPTRTRLRTTRSAWRS